MLPDNLLQPRFQIGPTARRLLYPQWFWEAQLDATASRLKWLFNSVTQGLPGGNPGL
jgi:hypothetical protein